MATSRSQRSLLEERGWSDTLRSGPLHLCAMYTACTITATGESASPAGVCATEHDGVSSHQWHIAVIADGLAVECDDQSVVQRQPHRSCGAGQRGGTNAPRPAVTNCGH